MKTLVFTGDDGKVWHTGGPTSWSPNYTYIYSEDGEVSCRSTALIARAIELMENAVS